MSIGDRSLRTPGAQLNDRDSVWQAGVERCPAPLLLTAPGSPSALQLLQALHRLTRLAVFRDLSSAEEILALFPENFHQNLKNLLTKIILEHV